MKPATILAWFRQLAARKYDSSAARRGRPPKPKDVRKLVIKLATENLRWGLTKIRDALRERFHQGLGGQLIEKPADSTSGKSDRGNVVCRSGLGGMLNFYHREAA